MVTTGVDGEGAPVLGALADAQPLTSTSISVTVDRYLDPRTPIRQAYCLRSDADGGEPASAFECVGALSTRPTYDPVSRTLRIYLDAPLTAETEYTLTVFAAVDGVPFGLRALDGVPLDESFHVGFSTSADLPDRALESPADRDPGLVTCAEVTNAWFLSCQSCHGSKGPGNLNLSKNGVALAVDRVTPETALGDQGSEAATAPVQFGVGMPIIASDNPGNSYLLYKVLARARYYPETDRKSVV